MRSRRGRVVLSALCVPLVGCSLFAPGGETPAGRATKMQAKCGPFAEESVAALLSPNAIDSVEPTYSYVMGGPNAREARLGGARIHVRPLPGLSRELVQRSLECHEARATLGVVTAQPDDPYVLPDRWLTIDVESEGDSFVVHVRADDPDDARRILDRAARFAGRRTPT